MTLSCPSPHSSLLPGDGREGRRPVAVKKTYPVSDVSLVGAETSGDYTPTLHVKTPPKDGQWGYPLMVVDPAYVARFPDYGPKAAAAMRTGKVVVPDELVISGGMVELASSSDVEFKSTTPFPGILVTSPPKAARLFSSALVSPEVAKTLGNVTPYQAVYELTREPDGRGACLGGQVARARGRTEGGEGVSRVRPSSGSSH